MIWWSEALCKYAIENEGRFIIRSTKNFSIGIESRFLRDPSHLSGQRHERRKFVVLKNKNKKSYSAEVIQISMFTLHAVKLCLHLLTHLRLPLLNLLLLCMHYSPSNPKPILHIPTLIFFASVMDLDVTLFLSNIQSNFSLEFCYLPALRFYRLLESLHSGVGRGAIRHPWFTVPHPWSR